jgi:SHS2 domain-containing protein
MTPPPAFEIQGHTADLRLYGSGQTKAELFSNMLFGMSSIIKPQTAGQDDELPSKEKIGIKSPDINALLVDFLNEVLYLSNVNKRVYRRVSFESFSDTNLKGEISGREIAGFDEDIKAVTYHELEIKQRPDGYYEATIIFDI